MSGLSERQRQILNLAVTHFIKTAEPVASRTLVKHYRLDVGAATIRNEMADLEELGYLEQPHTSAGRIPTDKGYREYVNGLREFSFTETERGMLRELEQKYMSLCVEFHEVLASAIKILSEVTNMVGIAALPRIGDSQIDKIQLLDVGHRRVLIVLVTCSGMVETHVIAVDTDIPQDKLEQVSRIFNENFSHSSIRVFVESYIDVLKDLRLEYRAAIKNMLERFFDAVGGGEGETEGGSDRREVMLEGATSVFKQPEFANFERARELLTAIEYKEGIARVVGQLKGVQSSPAVRIGFETRNRILKDLSMVVTSYTSSGLEHGTIGIIGPRRMNYPKVIASVDYISKLLTRTLTKP
jgi:heat-inducible transcriptional repressor